MGRLQPLVPLLRLEKYGLDEGKIETIWNLKPNSFYPSNSLVFPVDFPSSNYGGRKVAQQTWNGSDIKRIKIGDTKTNDLLLVVELPIPSMG